MIKARKTYDSVIAWFRRPVGGCLGQILLLTIIMASFFRDGNHVTWELVGEGVLLVFSWLLIVLIMVKFPPMLKTEKAIIAKVSKTVTKEDE